VGLLLKISRQISLCTYDEEKNSTLDSRKCFYFFHALWFANCLVQVALILFFCHPISIKNRHKMQLFVLYHSQSFIVPLFELSTSILFLQINSPPFEKIIYFYSPGAV
jgi:hypothetical protein